MKLQGIIGLLLLACLLTVGCATTDCKYSDCSKQEPGFMHIVFFWYDQDANTFQKQQLSDDCLAYLAKVKTVRKLEIGNPAGTPRDVVDNSYGLCLVVHFDDKEGHEYYQKAAEHLEFIERNKNVWDPGGMIEKAMTDKYRLIGCRLMASAMPIEVCRFVEPSRL